LAYFISHYLLLINRKWIAELMLWLFITGLLTISILSRKGILEGVNYTSLFPGKMSVSQKISNKRIMVLGEDLSLYEQNRLAGYFLNWELSSKYFTEPDVYENISKINQSILQDPPDVIIDQHDLMPPIMARIPMLEKMYRKEGGLYIKL
jgi:hypothetical protein